MITQTACPVGTSSVHISGAGKDDGCYDTRAPRWIPRADVVSTGDRVTPGGLLSRVSAECASRMFAKLIDPDHVLLLWERRLIEHMMGEVAA